MVYQLHSERDAEYRYDADTMWKSSISNVESWVEIVIVSTYKPPRPKIAVSATFFEVRNRRFHTRGIGMIRIPKSVTRLNTAVIKIPRFLFPQTPSILVSH